MSSMPTLLDRNRAYAAQHSPRPPAPRFSALVVTCMDARTDPAHFLGLGSGDALVIRNLGGRITPATERDIGVLTALAAKMGLDAPEVIVVHHTRCGVQKLADAALRTALANDAGVPEAELGALAIHDHSASLRTDIARLQASPHLPTGMPLKGVLLDLESGEATVELAEVVR